MKNFRVVKYQQEKFELRKAGFRKQDCKTKWNGFICFEADTLFGGCGR